MNDSSKIGAVNGLRGVAILMVVLHHLFIPFTAVNPLRPGEIDSTGLFAAFINNAWLGVNIFFVLSGFVLYLPYCTGRRTMNSQGSVLQFYLHRARRLLPLYYIVVLVTFALHSKAPAGTHNWYLELGGLLSTLFVFSPHGFLPPSNVVLWSVGVEIWFSILFPGFVLLCERFRIEKVVLGTLIACDLFIYIGHCIPIDRVGYFRPFTAGIFGCCYQFLLGMLVCRLYMNAATVPKSSRRHSRLLLPGTAVCAAGLYLMHHAVPFGFPLPGNMLFAIGFSVLLLALLAGSRLPRAVLESWTLQMLGCMCYSIYAWHGLAMNAMIPPASSTLADTLRILTPFLLVTLALSGLSYRYIEFGAERNWRKLFLVGDNLLEVGKGEADLARAARRSVS